MRRALSIAIVLTMIGIPAAQAQAAARTTLTITANLADGAKPYTWRLTCDPVGGNHPNRKAACALLKQGTKIFTPVPTDAICTEQYGGPQQVKVVGTVRGKKVNATFTRRNGCEISRYDQAAALFTIPGTTVIRGSVILDDRPVDTTVIFLSGRNQVTTTSKDGYFAARLGQGVWTGSADAGARKCTPVTITLPANEVTEVNILCRATS